MFWNWFFIEETKGISTTKWHTCWYTQFTRDGQLTNFVIIKPFRVSQAVNAAPWLVQSTVASKQFSLKTPIPKLQPYDKGNRGKGHSPHGGTGGSMHHVHTYTNLRLGSLGPSTVTLIACEYVAVWGGSVATVMDTVNILPAKQHTIRSSHVVTC